VNVLLIKVSEYVLNTSENIVSNHEALGQMKRTFLINFAALCYWHANQRESQVES